MIGELDRLARKFKVSTLVILWRIREAGYLSQAQFRDAYQAELDRALGLRAKRRRQRWQLLQHCAGPDEQAVRTGRHRQHARGPDAVPGRLPDARIQEGLRVQRTGAAARCRLVAYLLDANVFIQAKNLHYGFDFCPAFWDWVEAANRSQSVFSIEKVGDELLSGPIRARLGLTARLGTRDAVSHVQRVRTARRAATEPWPSVRPAALGSLRVAPCIRRWSAAWAVPPGVPARASCGGVLLSTWNIGPSQLRHLLR
jgi:Domain of unknown function (DUF4411)